MRARAVTTWLREAWPEADEEEWEYAALMAAADDSAALLTEEDPPRRVVLAVDVPAVVESRDSSMVEVDSAFQFRLVKAVHADTADIAGERRTTPMTAATSAGTPSRRSPTCCPDPSGTGSFVCEVMGHMSD